VLTDVSQERIASIFRVEDKKKKSSSEPAWAGATDYLLAFYPEDGGDTFLRNVV
jgi:hypothetical protein